MSYEVRIDAFEGPLDLLLHLLKEAKVNIYDIKISEITQQYSGASTVPCFLLTLFPMQSLLGQINYSSFKTQAKSHVLCEVYQISPGKVRSFFLSSQSTLFTFGITVFMCLPYQTLGSSRTVFCFFSAQA